MTVDSTTISLIIGVVSFLALLGGYVVKIVLGVHAQVDAAKKDASASAIEPIMDGLKGIKNSVDNMALRVDRVVEGQHSNQTIPRRRSSET